MQSPPSASSDLAALEQQLAKFIARELMSADGSRAVGADDDLIRQGVVDSLGITQLVDFCESRYGIRVTDADLVPANFQTVRSLAEFVARKRAESESPAPSR
jgi:acyl carrier protein